MKIFSLVKSMLLVGSLATVISLGVLHAQNTEIGKNDAVDAVSPTEMLTAPTTLAERITAIEALRQAQEEKGNTAAVTYFDKVLAKLKG